jgi:hypothetical protein
MVETDKRKKRRIGVALAVVAAIVVAAIVVQQMLDIRYKERRQAAHEAVFYCETFRMEYTVEPEIPKDFSILGLPRLDYLHMLFLEVEYVMEFPPEDERRWAVVYLKPDSRRTIDSTQWAVDELNKFIESDPSIVVDPSLTLPLTKEQVLSSPEAMLGIIRQLDAEQWHRLYDGYGWEFSCILAIRAGIEPPEELMNTPVDPMFATLMNLGAQ